MSLPSNVETSEEIPVDEPDAKDAGTAAPKLKTVAPPLIDAADPFSAIVKKGLASIARRANGDEIPIVTPWAAMNAHMRGGMWPGLYTLTGNTGSGKTQMALQIAIAAARASLTENAKDKRPVVYVALELGEVDMTARGLGLIANIPHWRIACPNNTADFAATTAAIAKHGAELRDLPLFVKVAPPVGWSYLNIRALAEHHKPKLMVIDYAQLVSAPDGSREDVRITVGNVAKIGRDIARTHNAVVLALCSTARANYAKVDGTEKDAKGQPVSDPFGKGCASRFVGLGKESGELEYTADCAMVLGNVPQPEGSAKSARKSHVAIAKGRVYGPGWVRDLNFDGSQFTDATSVPE